MNRVAARWLVCLLACGGSPPSGRGVAAQADGEMPPPVPAIVEQGPMIAGDGPAAEAIGDPWWDEAEERQPVRQRSPDGDEPDADVPAAPVALAVIQAQAQAEAVREAVRQGALAVLRRELSLVRQCCPSLERRQRAAVLQAARAAVEQAVDDAAVELLRGRRGRHPADIDAVIHAALQAALVTDAEDAEREAYEAERAHRQDRLDRAAVAVIVADVDRDAFLTDDEREALAVMLAKSYRDRWRVAATTWQPDGPAAAGPVLPGVARCVEEALGKERGAEWLLRREEARGGSGREEEP